MHVLPYDNQKNAYQITTHLPTNGDKSHFEQSVQATQPIEETQSDNLNTFDMLKELFIVYVSQNSQKIEIGEDDD